MPAFTFTICNSRSTDNLAPYLDAFPGYLERVTPFWPELVGTRIGYTPGQVPINFADRVTDTEALAYHTANVFGTASCVVERAQCDRYRLPYGPEMIHEVLEAGINPTVRRTAWAWLAGYAKAQLVMYEVCDPVAYTGRVLVNGVAFPNVTTPAYWAGYAQGPYDLAGVVEKPLPAIPHGGALMISGGSLVYGPAVPPPDVAPDHMEYVLWERMAQLREHMATKRGRRWLHGKMLDQEAQTASA